MLVSASPEPSGTASGFGAFPGRRSAMATDTVLLVVLLGLCGVISLRGVAARPQIPVPSAPSAPGHGPGPAPMAPAPFSAAAPAHGQAPGPGPGAPAASFVPILQQHFEQAPDGQFRWSYAAADGTAQEAIGELTASQSIAMQGSYSYPSPEGQVQVKYVADEFGFQPTGAHIHPAILEAVRRQVEQARAEPTNLYNDSGFPANGMGGAVGASPGPLPSGPGPQGGPPALAGLVSGSGPSASALL